MKPKNLRFLDGFDWEVASSAFLCLTPWNFAVRVGVTDTSLITACCQGDFTAIGQDGYLVCIGCFEPTPLPLGTACLILTSDDLIAPLQLTEPPLEAVLLARELEEEIAQVRLFYYGEDA